MRCGHLGTTEFILWKKRIGHPQKVRTKLEMEQHWQMPRKEQRYLRAAYGKAKCRSPVGARGKSRGQGRGHRCSEGERRAKLAQFLREDNPCHRGARGPPLSGPPFSLLGPPWKSSLGWALSPMHFSSCNLLVICHPFKVLEWENSQEQKAAPLTGSCLCFPRRFKII